VIRLRPHHLMCILTYVGRGYTPSFVRNLDRVIERIRSGAEILLVDEPDDICAAFDSDERHCERPSVTERDRAAVQALAGSFGERLDAGAPFSLSATTLGEMRGEYLRTREQTCGGCEWYELCGTIASNAFAETKLKPC
jgi:hypothetical protein